MLDGPPRRLTATGGMGVVVAMGCALAAWEGTLERTDTGARVGVLVTIAALVVGSVVMGRHRQRMASGHWVLVSTSVLSPRRRPPGLVSAGGAVWAALIAAAIGWDLYCFARPSPHLPTLSRLCGDVTGHQWGRALFFALWLALGLYIAVGWRTPSDGRRRNRRGASSAGAPAAGGGDGGS